MKNRLFSRLSKQAVRARWRFARFLGVAGALAVWSGFTLAAQSVNISGARAVRESERVSQSATELSHEVMLGARTSPQGDPGGRTSLPGFEGRRDPFKLPPPPVASRDNAALTGPTNLPPGPRGLIISDLMLEGVVSENAGHNRIAIVTNSSDRAYFLHENEELYDGEVTRITPQAVYFTERIRDHHDGQQHPQQVVKWLNSKAGEAR